ncbi:ABC transporter [Phytophthora megakarya]|uniref:ABC transporter n=1 Tax=Phytophthora megakarya TaxID=4795 RepID=A0A225X0E4_9STRA|nr:ABC transporter [Phytophthora megakarya]
MQLVTPFLVAGALFISSAVSQSKTHEETKTMDELYADAVAEGGNLVLYHGGDTSASQDTLHAAVENRFPKLNFTAIVDYSKYHGVRIDNQLETDTLIPDVVALQTLQDFTRWAKNGDLLPYKPANFSKIHPSLKDKAGAWLGYSIYQFSFIYNTTALNSLTPPLTPADLVKPEYAGKIASSYPHDDDAVLFLYTRYVEKYGWDWVTQLAQQNVSFNRGTNVARDLVSAGEKAIGIGSSVRGNSTTFVTDGTEYLSWGQRMGILSKAKHPAAAKLFMNWIISEEAQTSIVSNSPRTDINTKQPWDIPEANMAAFPTFMEDRATVEQWKQTFALYLGEVQGNPSPGWFGLHPGQ